MKLLTLTPEAQVYAVAALVVYSLSCGSLVDYLQIRCLRSKSGAYLPLYVTTMAVVSALAVFVLDLPSITESSWAVLSLSFPLGISAGAVAKWSEAAVKRLLLRMDLETRMVGPWIRTSYRLARLARAQPDLVTVRPDYLVLERRPAQRYYVLGLLLLAGALEEVLFRGVLVELTLSLPSPGLAVPCLMATVVVFALSHLRLGYSEVVAKLPLGLVTLLAALLTRSIVPAVVAHGFFNFWAWQTAPLHSSTGTSQGRVHALMV